MYETFSLIQTTTRIHFSFSGMHLKDDPTQMAYCILLLQTKCGKLHRLMHCKGATFLCDDRAVHISCRKANPGLEFPIRLYVYDPNIPVDINMLYELGHKFLSECNPNGEAENDETRHNWYTESSIIDDDDAAESDGEYSNDATSCASTTAPAPIKYQSYRLLYRSECPVPHQTGSNVLFYNNVNGLKKKGKVVKVALVGLSLGCVVTLKRYSDATNQSRFVFAGFMVVITRSSAQKSIVPLM
jgi:hypothetical protein